VSSRSRRAPLDRVSAAVGAALLPLVLGGDRTIRGGVVAGLTRHRETALVHLDGDADLGTPDTTGSGVLDTMGMTHLLGGGASALAGIGPRRPLLRPARVALLGFDPAELTTAQWGRLSALRLHAIEPVLHRLCQATAFAGPVVTEVNPDHDPDATKLATLADLLARVLARASPPPATTPSTAAETPQSGQQALIRGVPGEPTLVRPKCC
jgi:arginase family enzyme